MIARILAALLRALSGIATLPLRLLGWGGGQPSASEIANAAIDAPTPAPARAPAPEPDMSLGELIRMHACARMDGSPAWAAQLRPLPAEARSWLDRQPADRNAKLVFMRPERVEQIFRAEHAESRQALAAVESRGLALLHRRRPPARRIVEDEPDTGLALRLA